MILSALDVFHLIIVLWYTLSTVLGPRLFYISVFKFAVCGKSVAVLSEKCFTKLFEHVLQICLNVHPFID